MLIKNSGVSSLSNCRFITISSQAAIDSQTTLWIAMLQGSLRWNVLRLFLVKSGQCVNKNNWGKVLSWKAKRSWTYSEAYFVYFHEIEWSEVEISHLTDVSHREKVIDVHLRLPYFIFCLEVKVESRSFLPLSTSALAPSFARLTHTNNNHQPRGRLGEMAWRDGVGRKPMESNLRKPGIIQFPRMATRWQNSSIHRCSQRAGVTF